MAFNKTLLLQKLKALAAHLSISAVMVAIALWLMLWYWFPGPLFATDGGGVGLKLLLLVDLVLGPLLTFVVFNPGKARRLMVLDLSLIAAIQLAAYGYGLWNIHSVRVTALAFHEGMFYSVTADRFALQTIEPESWQALGAEPPYLAAVREPGDGDEASGVFGFAISEGLEPYQLQFLYTPLAAEADKVWQAGQTLEQLGAISAPLQAKASEWLQDHRQLATNVRFLEMQGFYDKALLVFDQQGHWLGGFAGALPKQATMPSSGSPRS